MTSSQSISEMPTRLTEFLRQGAPAILATPGEDGWPNAVRIWVAEWVGDDRKEMEAMELAVLAELREWEP